MENRGKLLRSEMIGKHLEVVAARNPANIGLRGEIIDETKETLLMSTPRGKKRLIKKNITIRIQNHIIHGEEIRQRPEERIKVKKWQK